MTTFLLDRQPNFLMAPSLFKGDHYWPIGRYRELSKMSSREKKRNAKHFPAIESGKNILNLSVCYFILNQESLFR